MKRSTTLLSILAILLLGFQINANAQIDAKNLLNKSFKVKDAKGKNEVELTFSSLSQKSLDEIDISEFTLTPLYEEETEETNPKNKSLGNDPVSSENADPVQLNKSYHMDRQVNKVVFVDMKPIKKAANVKGLRVELKSTGKEPSSMGSKSLRPANSGKLFFITNYRPASKKVLIRNYARSWIRVSFYYDSCRGSICSTHGDIKGRINRYAGYAFWLGRRGYAWYYNCNKQVGALVNVGNGYYHFGWTWWSRCR